MKNLWVKISYLGLPVKEKTLYNRTNILSNQINFLLFIALTLLYLILFVRMLYVGGESTIGTVRLIIVSAISLVNLLLARKGLFVLQKVSLIFLPSLIIIGLPLLMGFVEEESFVYYPYVLIAFSVLPQLIIVPSRTFKFYVASMTYFFILILVIDKLMLVNHENDFRITALINEFYLEYKIIPVFVFFFLNYCIYYLRSINQDYSAELEVKNEELNSTLTKLKHTQQHLVQSEKMVSVGTFTAGIAHEINNPLNFISGGVELLSGLTPEIDKHLLQKDKEIYRFALSNISQGLLRTTNIVSSLMNLAYRGNPVLVKVDLHEIINNTILFLKPKITDEIYIQKKYKLLEKIYIYPDKIHQVLLNLIDNALFAVNENPSGSPKTIEITTDFIEIETKPFVQIRIANNGPSISDDRLSHIFDPFYTTKPPGKGTGLGLSISYSLVKDHNGTIEAYNDQGYVVFKILIPLNLSNMKMKVFKPSNDEINQAQSWGTWTKEISEFPWEYDDKETCYILGGKATVSDKQGNSITFEKGDMVVFEQGLECTWKITEDISKKYKFG